MNLRHLPAVLLFIFIVTAIGVRACVECQSSHTGDVSVDGPS